MFDAFSEIEKIKKYPEISAKLAEMMPTHADDVRAVLASKRIAVDPAEIEQMIDIVRQHI
jgi:DNA-directed RNA polymerase subunit F